MDWTKYKYIGKVDGVCGGKPTILGTRLNPLDIALLKFDEANEDFGVTKEQYDECRAYTLDCYSLLDKIIEEGKY